MSNSLIQDLETTLAVRAERDAGTRRTFLWASWPGFFFALLQSVCTLFAALDGLRLLIGVSSLAVGAGVAEALDRIHSDWVRAPMLIFAVAGSVVNLAVLWQIRRLRKRPAAQWRVAAVSARRMWSEWVQLALSIVTLVLVAIEEYEHFRWSGHF